MEFFNSPKSLVTGEYGKLSVQPRLHSFDLYPNCEDFLVDRSTDISFVREALAYKVSREIATTIAYHYRAWSYRNPIDEKSFHVNSDSEDSHNQKKKRKSKSKKAEADSDGDKKMAASKKTPKSVANKKVASKTASKPKAGKRKKRDEEESSNDDDEE
jgi:cytoskeletal protein RodZ